MSRRPCPRRSRVGRFRWASVTLVALCGLLPALTPAGGDVSMQYRTREPTTGSVILAPVTAASASAGLLFCASTATGVVPFVSGNARGSVAVAEPRTCPSRTGLTFHPPLRFTNGLSVPSGHLLTVRITAISINGTVAMLRSVHFFVQRVGGGYPVVTATRVAIARGAVTVASSSAAVLTSGNTYGVGFRMSLALQATPGKATVVLIAEFVDADAGVVNAVDQAQLAFIFSY